MTIGAGFRGGLAGPPIFKKKWMIFCEILENIYKILFGLFVFETIFIFNLWPLVFIERPFFFLVSWFLKAFCF